MTIKKPNSFVYLFIASVIFAGLPQSAIASPVSAKTATVANYNFAVTMGSVAPALTTVVVPSTLLCDGTTESGYRFDQILNTNCEQLVLQTAPPQPKLLVVDANTNVSLVATSLPRAPTIRFVQAWPADPASYIPAMSGMRVSLGFAQIVPQAIVSSIELLATQASATKTLAELQVQRC